MASYVICGGSRLCGDMFVQGSKNAALPILAAALLNDGVTTLENCPDILDVRHMIKIIESVGCLVERKGHQIIIHGGNVDVSSMRIDYVSKMRSSVILLGALLGRNGKVSIPYPGGCTIGKRPIDLHLSALRKMNVAIEESNGMIHCFTKGISGCDIVLAYPSVGATENIILAAVLAKGTTTIHNPAKEPEVVDLCGFLNALGARVTGIGTETLVIEGVEHLKNNISYGIMADRIVAGTYMMAAAATGGNIRLLNVKEEDIRSIIRTLMYMGCSFNIQGSRIQLFSPEKMHPVDYICTEPFPGFPTDMQSQLMSTLTTVEGESCIVENVFEDRFKTAGELKKMGAKIELSQNEARITGIKALKGARVTAMDLRGGAALILAGLMAEGETVVEDTSFIERGYEDICRDFNALGAQIKMI